MAARVLLGAGLLATVVGCTIFTFSARPGGFRHGPHIAKGIACEGCHYDFDRSERAGMPTYRTCVACHGPAKDRTAYDYELVLQQKDPSTPFAAGERFFDLKFSHMRHYAVDMACSQCHGALGESARDAEPRRPSPETCAHCHDERGVSTECSSCHEVMRRDVPPPSHSGEVWMRTHGMEARFAQHVGHEESCATCHSQSSCDTCHQVEPPRDHGDFFRIRGHGSVAGLERERCAACHQEHFCVRCHAETEPRSHIGSWGGAQSRHCIACHEPLAEAGCSVCHNGTPSHRTATPIPASPHPPATSDCYRCHLRPPHADNGSPCVACHR